MKKGQRIQIPVVVLEFDEGGNTIWIQSADGGTTMRIKTMGKIVTDQCKTSPISHCDIIVKDNIEFCLGADAH